MRRYLEESYRCFVAEAFTSMVVMLWNAVAYYLRQVVKSINFGFLNITTKLYIEKSRLKIRFRLTTIVLYKHVRGPVY